MASSERVTISVGGEGVVSGLFDSARGGRRARACFVLAHGAGAGMSHPFMEAIAAGLAERGVAVLRFQFPYMERGSRRPDPPKTAQAAVRAAVGEARRLAPGAPVVAGGKSFGGRMSSQAQAESPLAGVVGLAFLGFPLHAAGRASAARGKHLRDVRVPMLFLQGTRDKLAELSLLKPLMEELGGRASLRLFEDADHSFHVPKRSGRSDAEVREELLDALVSWIEQTCGGGGAADGR